EVASGTFGTSVATNDELLFVGPFEFDPRPRAPAWFVNRVPLFPKQPLQPASFHLVHQAPGIGPDIARESAVGCRRVILRLISWPVLSVARAGGRSSPCRPIEAGQKRNRTRAAWANLQFGKIARVETRTGPASRRQRPRRQEPLVWPQD